MTTTQPAPPAPFTNEDFAARMRRVLADAARAELDGILVTPGPELVWLTGYQPTAITERLTVLVLRHDQDPIEQVRNRLLAAKVTEQELKAIDAEVREIVNASADFAQHDPEPDPSELWTDIYR